MSEVPGRPPVSVEEIEDLNRGTLCDGNVPAVRTKNHLESRSGRLKAAKQTARGKMPYLGETAAVKREQTPIETENRVGSTGL
jgi:hypothetical protein